MTQTKKETIYINYKSKSEDTKVKIGEWLSNQKNQSNSILTLIEHAIDRFGNVDIMNHEVSRRLYLERLYFDENNGSFSPMFQMNENTKAHLSQQETKQTISPNDLFQLQNYPPINIQEHSSEENKESESKAANKTDNTFIGLDEDAF